jgi:hypothetical protein
VPQCVRCDLLDLQGLASQCRRGGVLGNEPLDRVGAETPAVAGGEQGGGRVTGMFAQLGAHYGGHLRGQRGDTFLAPFAVAAHVRAGAELDVTAAEAGELRYAQPGLGG